MRALVFLLILANLLFYAWTHDYLGASRDSESYRVAQQLRAEQIRVVSNDLPPPEVLQQEIIDHLEAALASFRDVATALQR